jgi:hypothetical protein
MAMKTRPSAKTGEAMIEPRERTPPDAEASGHRSGCRQSYHGTSIHFVSQLDAPDNVPPRGRIPVNGRIAGLSHRCLRLGRDGSRVHTK